MISILLYCFDISAGGGGTAVPPSNFDYHSLEKKKLFTTSKRIFLDVM